MQLISLYVEDFKILKKFNIQFSREFSVTDSFNVIIGENGSGKTTLVECLLRIFSALYQCDEVNDISGVLTVKGKIAFGFTLAFYIKADTMLEATSTDAEFRTDYLKITISNIAEEWLVLEYADQVFINADVNNFLFKAGYSVSDLLPRNTVMYYSGFDSHLSEFASDYTYRSLTDLYVDKPKNARRVESINAPVFNFNPSQFNLLLFTLFCYEINDVSNFLQEKIGIRGFTELTVNFKRPKWGRGEASNFWGSRGLLRTALDKFVSAAKEQSVEKDSVSMKFFIPEHLLNLVGYEEATSFAKEREIFQSLIAFDSVGLLESVEVIVVKETGGGLVEINSQDLSEGEKQFLAIYGLKRVLSEDQTLFLFDEPDTFLHPKWKREFIRDIYYTKEVIKNEFGDFDIITSHSPELLGFIDNQEVKIMKNGVVYKEFVFVKGRDYNSILFDAFGTEKREEYGSVLLRDFYSALDKKDFELAAKLLDEIKSSFGLDDIETNKAIDNFEDYIGDEVH